MAGQLQLDLRVIGSDQVTHVETEAHEAHGSGSHLDNPGSR